MKLDLTPAVERALHYARRLARASGSDGVHPADWLHGLLGGGRRPAVAVLAVQAGLDWNAYYYIHDRLRAAVRRRRRILVAVHAGRARSRCPRRVHGPKMQLSGEAAVSGDLLLIAPVASR